MAHLQAVQNTLQAQQNGYNHLTTYYDEHNQIAWGYMHAEPRPCFTSTLMLELISWWRGIASRIDNPETADTRYVVLASAHPTVYNLGGDLSLLLKLITTNDYDTLLRYAHISIEAVYLNAMHLSRPQVKTVSLVQGDALGGGFECALSGNVMIAERGCKMGFPEIMFNLFPGSGAMTLLGRKIGYHEAERMLLKGRLYSSDELYEMGVVDILVEKGDGELAVYDFVRKESKQRNGAFAIRAAREISQPIVYDELVRIAELWVDAALRLDARDLRVMERLVARQNIKNDGLPLEPSSQLSA